MNRRLNPQLFEESSTASVSDESPSYSAIATQKVSSEVTDLKKTVSRLESVVEILQSQVNQVSKNADKRSEVFSTALRTIERSLHEQNQHLDHRSQRIEEQLSERQDLDGKIENMVDRFNMSLQQFENKLASLQKVISEKEMALLSYRDIIEKIVDEVEKLKAQR